MWSCGKGSDLTGNAAQFPGEPDRKLGKKPQGKRNVSCQDQGSAPLHPSANDSNLNGEKRKRDRIWDVLPEAKRRCMHRRGNGLNLLCRLLDPPEHLLSAAIRHHCVCCTAASCRCSYVPIQAADYFEFCSQFQKQGSDVEKVKQRLAEIANYVDKVKYPLPIVPLSFSSHLINLRWQQRLMRWLFDVLMPDFKKKMPTVKTFSRPEDRWQSDTVP